MSEDFLPLKFLGAVGVLCALAFLRFDRPSHVRTFTTRERFALGAFMYAAVFVVGMLFVYLTTRLVLRHLGIEIRSTFPVWVGFALALFSMWLPFIERPVRTFMQELSGAPRCAELLGQRLIEAKFTPNEKSAARAEEILRSLDIDVRQDWLENASAAQELLLCAAAQYVELNNLENDPASIKFVERATVDLKHLKQRFDRLSVQAARAFDYVEQVGEIHIAASTEFEPDVEDELEKSCRKLVEGLLADVCLATTEFQADACRLLARAYVTTEPRARKRAARIASVGFDVRPVKSHPGYRALALAGTLLFIGVLLYFAIVPGTEKDRLAIAVVITFSQVGAFAFGSVPKIRWGFANAGLGTRTPPAFMIGAGTAGLAWATIVNVVVGFWMNGVPGVIPRLIDGGHYIPTSFVTAGVTAWLVQDFRWAHIAGPLRRRVLDAVVMGLAWVLEVAVSDIGKSVQAGAIQVGDIYGYCGSFVFGAVLGAVVVSVFRAEPSRPTTSSPSRLPVRPRTVPVSQVN